MTNHEMLIRDAIAAEAATAVDSRVVMAELHKKRRKPLGTIFGVVGLTMAAAAAAVIIPTTIKQTTASPAGSVKGPQNILLVSPRWQDYISYMVLVRVEEDGAVAAVTMPHWYFPKVSERDSRYMDIPRYRTGDIDEMRADVQDLTGQRIDHHVVVPMDTLGKFATIVGGVDVCVVDKEFIPPNPIPSDIQRLPAGRNTIAGDKVKQFFDMLGENATYIPQRQRERAFFTGLAAKINGSNIAALAREAAGSVTVDEGWDVVGFAQRFRNGAPTRVTTIPYNPDTHNRFSTGGWRLTKEQAREYVTRFFKGEDKPAVPGVPPPYTEPTSECVI